MRISPRIPLVFQTAAAALAICFSSGALGIPQGGEGNAVAASSAAGDTQSPAPTGNFFSSLKQAFKQDLDRDVVRGHFDVGTPPDAHRYYCLVDAKTGRREDNGVAGQAVTRPDGMTGIKAGAVSLYSCATVEQQGNLVTGGYTLSPSLRSKVAQTAPRTPPPASAAAPSAVVAPSAAVTPSAAAAHAPVAVKEPDLAAGGGAPQADIMAVYTRFIAGQNAHDRAIVSDVLLDSKDFVWTQPGGDSLWGHKEALDAFQGQWKGTWTLDPQLNEARIASLASNVAVLTTPLLFTQGGPGEKASTVPIRWSGVFLKTSSGWRISSIFTAPFKNWPAGGG